MDQEIWKTIPDFSYYDISNHGRVYNNKLDKFMQISLTNHGHTKITLVSEWDNRRYTRSVAQLVAESFVDAPNLLCDHVVVLDGNHENVFANNLVWRPRWFAWKYSRQIKIDQPRHYYNLRVMNVDLYVVHDSIIKAGMTEGLLFDDIWKSTYTGVLVYPYGHRFEVLS